MEYAKIELKLQKAYTLHTYKYYISFLQAKRKVWPVPFILVKCAVQHSVENAHLQFESRRSGSGAAECMI